jgi:ubiquinone/menaquinone biosynthesis C-methylase UbiE
MTHTLRTILIILSALSVYQVLLRLVRKRWHFPAPAITGWFLGSRLRAWMQSPMRLAERTGAQPGMVTLEIGCGSGAFTTAVARAVGPSGELHALDVQPGMLRQTAARLARPEYRDIQNVTLHLSDAYDLPFDDASLDLVYLVTVLPEIRDMPRALAEIKRVLRPGGLLALGELLLDPDYPLQRTTVRLGQEAGLTLDTVAGNFWTYVVRFRKP